MREIDWRIKAIIDRKNLDATFEAKIHGMELKMPKVSEEVEEIKVSDKQQKAMDEAIKQAMARKKAEFNG